MTESVDCLLEDCRGLLFPEAAEEEAVVPDTAVAVRDGRILDVGPTDSLRARFEPARTIAGRGRLLTPGFVDCHTHLVFGGQRAREFVRRCQGASYEEIAAEGGGIRSTVRSTRDATEDELFDAARPRLLRMLESGSTTVEIKSGYGLDLETELRMLRVIRRLGQETPVRIVPTFLGAHEVPDELREDRAAFVADVCDRMIPTVAEERLARFNDVFCESGVFTPEESRRILEAGLRHGLKPKIHADELAASGGSDVAASVGAVSADHLVMIDSDNVARLREAGVVPVLLPGTTFYLGKDRYAPARQLLDAGLPVALATDRNPGSSTVESMLFIVGLACLRMGMTPLEAFRAATTHAARALDLQDECGRLAPGLAADLILWEAETLEQVVYEFENNVPRKVWAAGRQVALRAGDAS